jgi:FkbM family methyltransferase
VVNIEPHPEIGGYLASNQEVFGDHLGIGLSDDRGSLNFFISELNPEGHSLVESSLAWGDSGYARKISVQVDSFDQVFENDINNLRVFHLVKVDVEGHEEAVVTGMKNALEKGLVKNLWCEVRGPGSDRNPSSYMGVCQAMTEHGYEPYLYCRGKIKPFDPDSDNIPQYFDLLFMRDE